MNTKGHEVLWPFRRHPELLRTVHGVYNMEAPYYVYTYRRAFRDDSTIYFELLNEPAFVEFNAHEMLRALFILVSNTFIESTTNLLIS